MIRNLIALACGILFGIGLSLSQMINPNKVQGFLDITGQWDASLALVMIGALVVTVTAFRFVLKKPTPVFEQKFYLSSRSQVDKTLVIGAALFGIGWGLSGYCPGPAIAGLSLMTLEPLVMVISICVGFVIHKFLFDYLGKRNNNSN